MAVINLSGLIFSDSSQLYSKYGIVESQTTMLFYQAAAPTGWTKKTDHNNKSLRVVSGVGSATGGANPFTGSLTTTDLGEVNALMSGTVGDHTLLISEIPSHSHNSGSSQNVAAGPASPSRYLSRAPVAYSTRAFYNQINNYQQPSSYRQPQQYRQPQVNRTPQIYRQPTNKQNPQNQRITVVVRQPNTVRNPTNKQNPVYSRTATPARQPFSYQNPFNVQNPFRTNQRVTISNPQNRQNPQSANYSVNSRSPSTQNRRGARRAPRRNPVTFSRRNRRGGRRRNRTTQSGNRRAGARYVQRTPYGVNIQNPFVQNRTVNRRRPSSTQSPSRQPNRTNSRSPNTANVQVNVRKPIFVRVGINRRAPSNVQNPANARNFARAQQPNPFRTPVNVQNPKTKQVPLNTRINANKRIVANKNVPVAVPTAVRYPQVNNARYPQRTLVPGGSVRGDDNAGPLTSTAGGDQAHYHEFSAVGNTGAPELSGTYQFTRFPLGSKDFSVRYVDVILCYLD